MSQSPPTQPENYHIRQSSLQTVYEDNDPYRIAKKNQHLDSFSDGTVSDVIHSRTASDSSTSRLYANAIPFSTSNKYEDPYAKTQHKKWRTVNNDRANSYLPYSHHARDPNQKSEPIYIEEYAAPASTTLGIGSMLHDGMPPDSLNNQASQQGNDLEFTDKMMNLPDIDKRRRKRKRICGLRYRTAASILFLLFVVVIIVWYFVWPRIPVLSLNDVDNIGSIQVITNSTKKSLSANWLMNMTADNTNNWVPTRIQYIDMTISDDNTDASFGTGTSGFLVLPAKKKSFITIPMSIYYASDIANDTTFQDLYNACGVQVTSNMPFDNKQDVLNITIHIAIQISGFAWTTRRHIPYYDLSCPTS
ncbi:uncharacterized protein BX663DRAFT_456854 [Cokeromyces recurvatus]|uniref:uncharacterized protein n=1 Tax=Cokeromyces recurvatus TaxID=90255 RepID=UPI002220C4EF|nr:uncharacterized protein BX663DRAFT_456854 [Cokeromyces recurvatus]KAI7901373.1 hypothetical protein BX663DRAFT_456854 [Cokeromyces recurvatus]